jgi:adenosylcobinamide kinase/adenosylcobinamide-phosphate guanylyltransferase
MIVLVTGGARSGKSVFAETYARSLANQGVYLATAEALDEEMARRIELHRRRRRESGFFWQEVEEPYDVSAWLRKYDPASSPGQNIVLIDCLTLWLSNWLLRLDRHTRHEAQLEEMLLDKLHELLDAVRSFPETLIMVSNEVGSGIVPETRLGRVFRDMAGIMNRKAAEVSDQVFLVAVGIPVELKSLRFPLPPEHT